MNFLVKVTVVLPSCHRANDLLVCKPGRSGGSGEHPIGRYSLPIFRSSIKIKESLQEIHSISLKQNLTSFQSKFKDGELQSCNHTALSQGISKLT